VKEEEETHTPKEKMEKSQQRTGYITQVFS
jgi:hypothetical protein